VRKIVAAPFVSLDGVVELSEPWTIPYFTADMQQVIQQGMAAADTMLMGRRTYEQMAAYWPNLPPRTTRSPSSSTPAPSSWSQPPCSRSTGGTQP
jgi:dihydrofolate reductase